MLEEFVTLVKELLTTDHHPGQEWEYLTLGHEHGQDMRTLGQDVKIP